VRTRRTGADFPGAISSYFSKAETQSIVTSAYVLLSKLTQACTPHIYEGPFGIPTALKKGDAY